MDSLVKRMKEKAGEEYGGVKSCALAYSGGIDSQVIGSLLEEMGIDVLPVIVDLGGEGMEDAAESAKKIFGKVKVMDVRPRLRESAVRAIKANCLNSGHLNAGGITRPLMAQALAEAAYGEGITCIAHGSSGLGNDHLRIELALRVLGPDLRVLAPVRDWNLHRDEALQYAKSKGWKHKDISRKYSVDESLYARIARQGSIVDAEKEIPAEAQSWVKNSPQKEKSEVEITFVNGMAVKAHVVHGKRKVDAGPDGIFELLNKEGGLQGIGRMDVVGEKLIGLKNRELHECPAVQILVMAHADLERITLTSSQLEAKAWVDRLWNRTVHEGGWFTRLRRDLDAFIDSTQAAADGKVFLQMHNGSLHITGRNSPRGLYDSRLSRRDKAGVLNQKAAAGFAKIYGLQDTMAYLMRLE